MKFLRIRGFELETRDDIWTFGICDIVDIPFKIDQHVTTTPNSALRRIVDEIKKYQAQLEADR